MVTDILVVLLMLIGLGTVIYWAIEFCLLFINELKTSKNNEEDNVKETILLDALSFDDKIKEKILEELKQLDIQTLTIALSYARSLTSYGVDVTEKWETATEQSANLEKAYQKGYYEGVAAKFKEDEEFTIAELEKAKTEMKKRRDALDNGDLNDYKKCKMQGYSDSMGILDHLIKELKGGG